MRVRDFPPTPSHNLKEFVSPRRLAWNDWFEIELRASVGAVAHAREDVFVA